MRATTDLYWAAGFLEGEGSFLAHTGCCRVSANQVQRQPLERLAFLFGGSIRYHKNKIWVWRINGTWARGVMMTLFGLMSFKRKGQIRKALSAWANKKRVRRYFSKKSALAPRCYRREQAVAGE